MTQPFRARVWQQGFNREDQAKVVLEREDGQPFTIAEAQDIAKQVTTLSQDANLRERLEFQRTRADKWVEVTIRRDVEIEELKQRLRADALAPPEPKALTRDDCIALENLCAAKVREVREYALDDAVEFSRLMQKVIAMRTPAPPRADALEAPRTAKEHEENTRTASQPEAACADQPWQPLTDVSPARERELWFWIRPKTAEETYHDTSGRPILSAAPPRLFIGKRGTWPSLMTATHWMEPNWPAPAVTRREGDASR